MALIPLQIPPGVHRNGTDFELSNRWRESNLVRWHDGSMRPVGGWTTRKSSAFASAPRAMLSWVDNTSGTNLVAGTYNKLYYVNQSSTVYDITLSGFTSGSLDATVNTAYGGSYWGTGNYGTARTSTGVYQEATTWSLDTWGQNLLGCSVDDGKIYEWTLSTSTLPTALTNAPVNNKFVLVTEERFVFALASGGNPRKIQWSDREDNTVWTASATNEAGDFELQTQGQIMCGVRMRGRSLILTDQDAHISTYQGPPFVYGFERVGTACGVASRKSAVAVDEGAFWMGHKAFYTFNGSVATEIKCDVLDYVFDNLNRNQISKVYAVHNSQFGEIWWFYPSGSSKENDRYVTLDYKEEHWTIGSLGRTACVDRGVFDNPIWSDASGNLLNQETGINHGSSVPYAESGPISLGNGDNVMRVTNLIPDEKVQGEVKVSFKTRLYPNDTETTYGPYTLLNPTDVRFTGRQVRIKVEGNGYHNWRSGIMRIEARPGSKR